MPDERFDEGASFYYEITSRQSLRLVLERKRLNQEELLKLLNGMYQAVQSCAEYLLDVDRLLLDPDYIYLDPGRMDHVFLLLSCGRQDFGKNAGCSLLELAEYLLDRLDRQDSGAVTLGYEFYRIAGEENPSLGKLLESWQETERKAEAADAAYAGEPQRLRPQIRKSFIMTAGARRVWRKTVSGNASRSETLTRLLRNGRKAKMEAHAALDCRKSGSRDCFSEARTRPARICASPRTAFSSEKRRTRWTAG